MLQELIIRNFAIIDDLTIRFAKGLTILSGETGAGKSILINAVNLLLGSRATTNLIRTGADSAELEALFHISSNSIVATIMDQLGYDSSEGLLVRRIISRSGQNRIYINGRLATIGALTSITENLASISGQHAHQGLLKEDQHLLVLDQYGRLMALRNTVEKYYHQIVPLIEKYNQLKETSAKQSEHIELLKFQKHEIISAAIMAEEDELLEQERKRLKNAEFLYQTVYGSTEELYGQSGAVSESLVEIKKAVEKASRIDANLNQPASQLEQITFLIEDVVETLRAYLNTIELDDSRLEIVEERMDTLNRLKRKYGGSLESIQSQLGRIKIELNEVENIGDEMVAVAEQLNKLHLALADAADRLSVKRKKAAKTFAKQVMVELASLKMSSTKFDVSFQPISSADSSNPYLTHQDHLITETGIDRAQFIIAPNIGENLKPLTDIASGGELSRVVLALKAMLAKTESVETVIFDEVDAGIGGSVAEVVGQKLNELSEHHQIICITHLPQIAKFGDSHFCISKTVLNGRTQTMIQPLDKRQRVQELARMLGGVEITQATLEHARELLNVS